MLLFTAFQTATMTSKERAKNFRLLLSMVAEINHKGGNSAWKKFITDSIKRDLSNTTNMTQEDIDASIGDGYISISVVYAIFALSNFFSPVIVKLFGHKGSMVCSFQSHYIHDGLKSLLELNMVSKN